MSKKRILSMLISYLISPILGIIILPIVTKYIQPEIYGKYNYYIFIVNLIMMISLIQSQNSTIMRFLNKSFENFKEDLEIIKFIFGITSIIYICISLIVAIKFDDTLYLYIASAFFINSIINHIKSYYKLNGQDIRFSIISLLSPIFQYSLIFIVYYLDNFNIYIILMGTLLFNIFYLFYFLRNRIKVLSRINLSAIQMNRMKEIFLYTFAGLGISISGLILSLGDRFIIKNYLERGSELLGIYSVNYSVYSQIIDLTIALFFLLIPNYLYPTYERFGIEKYLEKLKYLLELYIVVGSYILIILIFTYDKINFILFDEKYLLATKLPLIILFGQYFFGFYRLVSNYFTTIKKRKILNLILAVTAIVNILLNLLLVPKFGIEGAAFSTLLCYFSVFILVLLYVARLENNFLIGFQDCILILFMPILLYYCNYPKIYSDKEEVFILILRDVSIAIFFISLVQIKKIKKIYCYLKGDN